MITHRALTELFFPVETIDSLFPHEGEEGENVRVSPEAEDLAKTALGIKDTPDSITEIEWHLPNVFDVRYGSSYVASAWVGDKKVRFHMNEGDFREGDDK